MAALREHHKFTVEEYELMIEHGLLTKNDRVELIEGEIVEMAPIGTRHSECVARQTRLFARGLPDNATVRVQSPVRVPPRSAPEPDLAVVRARPEGYGERHPEPADLLLVVEVADSSLREDRAEKIPLYARAGIQEAWLWNLVDNRLEIYREPGPGGYVRVVTAERGELVSPLAFPELSVAVGDVLP